MLFDIETGTSIDDVTAEAYLDGSDLMQLAEQAQDIVNDADYMDEWQGEEPDADDYEDESEYEDAYRDWQNDEPTDHDEATVQAARDILEHLDANEIDKDAQYIHEDSFEDHARELAEDIGALENATNWPCACINWEKAAEELQQDYSVLEIAGDTYFYR